MKRTYAKTIFLLMFAMVFILPSIKTSAHGTHKTPISSNYNSYIVQLNDYFTNKNSMTEAQIQAFLKAKVTGGVCDTNKVNPYGSTPKPPWICLYQYKDPANANKLASKIIYEEAQEFGINPQVILVTLQKEQSLITDNWPWPIQYKTAMGYGCPESETTCNAKYYGFTNQVHLGTKLLRVGFDRATGNNTSYPGWTTTKYTGTTTIDKRSTFIGNGPTASLYNYTPHRPDSAWRAISCDDDPVNGCHYYGNYNFIYYVNLWFPEILPTKISLTRFRVSMEDATTPLDDTDYVLASTPAVGEPITISATLKNSNIYSVTLKNIRILGTLASGTKFTVATISSLTLPAGATISVPAQTFKITSLYTHTFSIDYQINNLRYSPHVDSDYSYQRITAHYPNVKVVKTPVITPSSPKVNSAVAVTYKLKNYDARPAYLKAISFIARYGGKTPYYFPKISQKIMPSSIYQYTNSTTFSIPGYYYGAAQVTYGNDTTVIPSALASCKNTANFRIYPN